MAEEEEVRSCARSNELISLSRCKDQSRSFLSRETVKATSKMPLWLVMEAIEMTAVGSDSKAETGRRVDQMLQPVFALRVASVHESTRCECFRVI
jgi:hypothetical protein